MVVNDSQSSSGPSDKIEWFPNADKMEEGKGETLTESSLTGKDWVIGKKIEGEAKIRKTEDKITNPTSRYKYSGHQEHGEKQEAERVSGELPVEKRRREGIEKYEDNQTIKR